MSTLRNAVQRRNHRERAQPQEREKWGILEKHKDYSLRAKDFNVKKAKLRALRQKATDRNPDEFYFGMMSAANRTDNNRGGTGKRHGQREFDALSQDVVRLMKTQDMGYIRTTRNVTRKEVEDLRKRLVLLRKGADATAKKIVYVDSERERDELMESLGGEVEDGDDDDEDIFKFDPDEDEFGGFADDDAEEESDDDDEEDIDEQELERRKLREKEVEKLQARLDAAEARLKALTEAEEALELQRARMAKSPTVGGVNKHGLKFKVRERKR